MMSIDGTIASGVDSYSARKLNITLLAEYFLPRLGGVEIFVSDLAEVLQTRGHRVRVLTSTRAVVDDQGSRIPTVVRPLPRGVEVTRVDGWSLPGVGVPLSPRLPFRFRQALSDRDTDVVHVHASIASLGALAGGWAARSMDLPIVMTLHSVLGGHAVPYRWSAALTGWGTWPRVVAGVSQPVSEELTRTLGREAAVLPNGVDVGWWAHGRPARPDRGHEGLELVTVQRLKKRKRGHALLTIVAAAAAALDGPPPRITFVGDGPRRAQLETKADALGVDARFLGTLDRVGVRDALRRADVFVLASQAEAFGLAAAEARAAGLPVVAYRSGALPELVEHERTGLLADSDAEICAALTRLANDPGLLQELTEGSAATPPPCDWTRVAELHESAYLGAISGA